MSTAFPDSDPSNAASGQGSANIRKLTCECGCGQELKPASRRARFARRFASDACRVRARNRAIQSQLRATQQALDFTPPVLRVAVPPHNPKAAPKLQRACLAILELLEDGEPHTRHELYHVGGIRYAARLNELVDAGKLILGPEKRVRRRIFDTEPMRDGVECYRLVRG